MSARGGSMDCTARQHLRMVRPGDVHQCSHKATCISVWFGVVAGAGIATAIVIATIALVALVCS